MEKCSNNLRCCCAYGLLPFSPKAICPLLQEGAAVPAGGQPAWVIATQRLPTPVCHLFPGARLFLFFLFPAIPPQRFDSPGSFPYIPSVSLHYFLIKIRENGLKTVLLLLKDSHKSQSTAGGQLLTAVEAISAWKSAPFPWFFYVFIENCHSNKSMIKSKIFSDID